MARYPEPFEQLAPDVQAEVQRITRDVQALAGAHTQLRGTGHAAGAALAVELHQVLTASYHVLASAEQIERHRARIEDAQRALDDFTSSARQSLLEAGSLLGDIERLVGDDERRRAEEAAAESQRRRLDAEVDRLVAAEEAQAEQNRRRRLEDRARERLSV